MSSTAPTPSLLMHSSGGLVYHWRALRHGRGLWRPYRQVVADWLADWRPASDHLLLLGPSGGYALDQAFLARFAHVGAVEPDPLARRLLARRFPRIAFEWQATGKDLLAPARAHPGAALLFCNLLGQDWLGGGGPDARRSSLRDLPGALAERSWASFHDVVSTAQPPRHAGPLRIHAGRLEDVLEQFWAGGELPLLDHETWCLSAGRAADYTVWTLAPGRYHLVAWVRYPG